MHTDTLPNAGPSGQFPRVRRTIGSLIGGWNRLGSQMQFFVTAVLSIPKAVASHRAELLRLLAQMGMGAGALAVVGGGVGVFFLLTMVTGSVVGTLGYSQLGSVGLEALTGLAGSVLNIRFMVPGTSALAASATIGAGATAQLGAMRINEEIDALEVMGVRSIVYLASTRVVAGVIVVIPLFCVSTLAGFLATRVVATVFYEQGSGVYDHYFNTFLNSTDVLWSFFMTLVLTAIIMLVHTYYGFNASGGPAGVGEAVGRSVRTSMVIAAMCAMMISLAAYGQSGNLHIAS
jgi:phospholipid/cholesterol/gamma-HCH transport system permease protein